MFCNCERRIVRLEKALKNLLRDLGGKDGSFMFPYSGEISLGFEGRLGRLDDRTEKTADKLASFAKALGYEQFTCVEETKWKKIKKGGKNGKNNS